MREHRMRKGRRRRRGEGSAESQRYPFMLHGCLAAALVLPCKKTTSEEGELKVGLSPEPFQSTNPLQELHLATFTTVLFTQSIQSIHNPTMIWDESLKCRSHSSRFCDLRTLCSLCLRGNANTAQGKVHTQPDEANL